MQDEDPTRSTERQPILHVVHVAGMAASVGSEWNGTFEPPTESKALGCFIHQGGIMGGNPLPDPSLNCDACNVARYELLAISPDYAICSVCYTGVAELCELRHGGEFSGWRAKGYGRTKKLGRLTDPPTPKESLRVYRRDSFTCRYCADKGGDLTVDHIDPEGGNSMENFATACRSCNSKKGRSTPNQAGMLLLHE